LMRGSIADSPGDWNPLRESKEPIAKS